MRLSKFARRLGCGILLVIWFTLMLTPCLVITLVMQREIVISYSDLPEDAFRIWLLMEAKERGIAIFNSRRVNAANDAVCVVVDGRFFMWQGSATPPHYCSCYTKQNGYWNPVAEGKEACQMSGEQ